MKRPIDRAHNFPEDFKPSVSTISPPEAEPMA